MSDLETRSFGRTGLNVTVLGFGGAPIGVLKTEAIPATTKRRPLPPSFPTCRSSKRRLTFATKATSTRSCRWPGRRESA